MSKRGPEPIRKLTEEALTRRLRFPTEKHFAIWGREHNRGCNKGIFYDIKKGRPAPEKHFCSIVELLRDKNEVTQLGRERSSFQAFLTTRGVSLDEDSVHGVIQALTNCVEDDGAFSSDMGGFKKLFSGRGDPTLHVRPAALSANGDAHEVIKAIEWMYVSGGRRFGGHSLDPEAAKAKAAQVLGVNIDDFTAQSIEWRESVEWSLAVLDTRKGPSAVSLMAPLDDHSYQELRSGRKNMLKAQLDGRMQTSRSIYWATYAPNPDVLSERDLRSLWWVFKIGVVQQARLSDVKEDDLMQPLRIITTACTKDHELMLRMYRYKSLKTKMKGTSFPLYERVLLPKLQNPESDLYGKWFLLQHRLRRRFGSPPQRPSSPGSSSE